MTASTLTGSATRPNAPSPGSDRPVPRETCPAAPGRQSRPSEADRVFEARLRWFLAVSRAA